jgi:hypothetical protein
MIQCLSCFSVLLFLLTASSCANRGSTTTAQISRPAQQQLAQAPVNTVQVIHVFVALADNVNQGIVPVSTSLGRWRQSQNKSLLGCCFRREIVLFQRIRTGSFSQSHRTPRQQCWSVVSLCTTSENPSHGSAKMVQILSTEA